MGRGVAGAHGRSVPALTPEATGVAERAPAGAAGQRFPEDPAAAGAGPRGTRCPGPSRAGGSRPAVVDSRAQRPALYLLDSTPSWVAGLAAQPSRVARQQHCRAHAQGAGDRAADHFGAGSDERPGWLGRGTRCNGCGTCGNQSLDVDAGVPAGLCHQRQAAACRPAPCLPWMMDARSRKAALSRPPASRSPGTDADIDAVGPLARAA